MKRRTRTIIGLVLILSAIGLMIYWEAEGRDQVRTVSLLVAARPLLPGEVAEKDMFTQRRVEEDIRIKGAMKPDELDLIVGQQVLHPVAENSQITTASFGESKRFIKEEQGIFLIRGDWIFSVSSSLRKGDRIQIYTLDGNTSLGEFRVAFVKDSQGKEVTLSEEGHQRGEDLILDRIHSTSPVDHLEILADIREYQTILEYLFGGESQEGETLGYQDFIQGKLILKQEEERSEKQ